VPLVLRLFVVLVLVGVAAVYGFMGGFGRVAGAVQHPAPTAAQSATAQPQGNQTIQITEAELDQRLTQQLVGQPIGSTPLGPATLTRISTHLADDHVQADGDAKVAAATVPVSLTASGAVQNGRAVVLVDDLRAAGAPLPPNVRDSVQQALQSQLDQAVDRQQLRVSSMTIGGGKLTLTGSHR
jgi:hypothetical protein